MRIPGKNLGKINVPSYVSQIFDFPMDQQYRVSIENCRSPFPVWAHLILQNEVGPPYFTSYTLTPVAEMIQDYLDSCATDLPQVEKVDDKHQLFYHKKIDSLVE